MTPPHGFFENLDCSRNFYFYCFHLASRKGNDATWSSRLAARNQVDRDYQKTLTKTKEHY
jgi:hypothetical protein